MTNNTVKTQITTISTVFRNVLKRSELLLLSDDCSQRTQLTCMATLSHLPPLDNSLIPSWSPPWFLWSWQPHKPDRDRLRRWVISGGRLQYFSPPPLSSWKGKDWNLVGFHFWKSLRQMTNIRLMGSRQTWKLTKFVKFLVWELSEASYLFNRSNLSVNCKYVDDLRS